MATLPRPLAWGGRIGGSCEVSRVMAPWEESLACGRRGVRGALGSCRTDGRAWGGVTASGKWERQA